MLVRISIDMIKYYVQKYLEEEMVYISSCALIVINHEGKSGQETWSRN